MLPPPLLCLCTAVVDFPRFDRAIPLAYDTETFGLGSADRAFGVSVAFEGWSGYIDLREQPGALRWLADAAREASVLVAHNAPFDYRAIHNCGVDLPLEKVDDTITRACLIDEHLHSYALDDLADRYLGERKQSEIYGQLAALFGGRATRGVQMPNIHRAPADVVAPYAIRDAELTLALWIWQEAEIRRQGIEKICRFERSTTPTIITMMLRGIRVDLDRADSARAAVRAEADRLQSELDALVGFEINVNSTPQVRKLFNPKKTADGWVADNGTPLGTTDAGAPSIGSEALRAMGDDRRAELILEVRSAIKTADTFLGGHILGSAVGDRVYPTINQTRGETAGTVTGRLSYTTPAMQQIPSRNKRVAEIVKPVFLPNEGQVWLDSDCASQEVRVFAHLINNPTINAMYRENIDVDFHQAVADLTGLPRNATYSGQPNSKQLNLSMIFNSGNGAIAAKMGMGWEWAEFTTDEGERVRYRRAGPAALEIIENYHSKLPGVKELAKKASGIAGERGYIKTHHGRRIRFPDKRYLYKASGLLIQATAADINKMMVVSTNRVAESFGGSLVLNTHDSFSLSLPEDWKPAWAKLERLPAELFGGWLNVPLKLELSGVGCNWWESIK